MWADIPLRRSLFGRLLALSLVVCTISVVATALLVVRSTRIDSQQSAQTLAKDRLVYRTLLDYATTHASWQGVAPAMSTLATETGYRIILTSSSGALLADSAASASSRTPAAVPSSTDQARTIVDPNRVDTFLLGGQAPTGAARETPGPVPARCAAGGSCYPPAAYLFVAPDAPTSRTFFDLSASNRRQIALYAAIVLLVAASVSVVVGRRITRPLRALAVAATRMSRSTEVRVTPRGGDEIAAVATAFNAMADSLEEQEQVRTQLVGDVAHELRTPLSNIRGQVEAAQDGLLPLGAELLSSLHEETLLLQHVVDDLQELALSDAGALRLHLEQVDVRELASQTNAALSAAAAAAGVALRVADGRSAIAVVDPVRLRQAVANLVSNAIHHTPRGGTVTTAVRRTDGATTIEVADTGSGIAPDSVARVFDRFWRSDPSRARSTGGSGLGLAIVKSIVELHGGSVAVTSRVAVGSTFTITLPTEARPTAAPTSPLSASAPGRR